jgi:hypothetical protein
MGGKLDSSFTSRKQITDGSILWLSGDNAGRTFTIATQTQVGKELSFLAQVSAAEDDVFEGDTTHSIYAYAHLNCYATAFWLALRATGG